MTMTEVLTSELIEAKIDKEREEFLSENERAAAIEQVASLATSRALLIGAQKSFDD